MFNRRKSETAPPPTTVETAPQPAHHGKQLGALLVEAGLITPEQLDAGLEKQKGTDERLGAVLVEAGWVSEGALADVLAQQLDTPVVDLREHPSTDEALALLSYEDARRLAVLPLSVEGKTLTVATDDPTNVHQIQEVAALTDYQIVPRLALRSLVLDAIRGRYRTTQELGKHVEAFATSHLNLEEIVNEVRDTALQDAPVVRIVNLLVSQAIRDRASDLHIEPQDGRLRIRARVDGILRDVADLPPRLGPGLASRIKIMADLNIVEKNKPQDGQFSMEVDGKPLDVRVASMRTIWGEKVVLRLLDKSRSVFELEQMGMPEAMLPKYRRLLTSPSGMVVISGPTGSGKTTTLYASINEVDRDALNISTIEDPVEYTFDRISQTQVNLPAGVNFAVGLRAILRQDPDVILVGEVRDRETAEIAVQASLTGHLVLSSMHATDAPGVLFRMLEMGIESYLVAASVTGVGAQRLIRRICHHCGVDVETTAEERLVYESAGIVPPAKGRLGRGCTYCGGTGFLDRIAAYELLLVDQQVRHLLTSNGDYDSIRGHALSAGMVPLRTDALGKAASGLTTVTEALRAVS
jgi:type IV pilus assembly protein PilB